jgi:hypothetical protein
VTNTERCRRLADEILSCFDSGLTVDRHARRYIDACLPGISLEEVGRRTGDSPDADTAPLLDLIFFPDEAFQMRLEPQLEKEMYNLSDEAEVAALLDTRPILTTLREPETCKTVRVRVPPSVLATFVRRLGITRHIPPRLASTISSIHDPEAALRLKVILRNTRFSFSPPFVSFLEAFFLGMGTGEDIDACLESILALLGEHGSETDPFRLLRLKTDTLYKSRDAALQFEKQLRRNNMETLMQLGIRAPEISAAEADEKIVLLERIGRAVALGGCEARRRGKRRLPVDGKLEPENGPLLPG